MDGKDNDETYAAYKKLEEEWNKDLKRLANCHQFVSMVSELTGSHLNWVQGQKAIMNNWLDLMGYPTKEEIADVAKKFILNEHRLDELDELVYGMRQNWGFRKQSLASLLEIQNELGNVINKEYFENKNNKIKSLVDELNEAKTFFIQ